MGDRLAGVGAVLGHHRHALAAFTGPAERCVNSALPPLGYAPNQRLIGPFKRAAAPVIGKLGRQPPMRAIIFGHNQQTRCVFIQPMNDTGTFDPANTRQAFTAMGDQSVHQRAGLVAGGRVHHKAGRFIEHDEVIILIMDIKGNDFR